MKSQKVKTKLHFPLFRNKDKDNHNVRYKTESQNTSTNKNQNSKIRSQTKIYRNQFLFKIQEKKGINVNSRPQSIDMSNEENISPKKNSPLKKIASPKKKGISPIKKLTSPRKLINSVQALNDGQINTFQKSNKKGKNSEGSIINKFV